MDKIIGYSFPGDSIPSAGFVIYRNQTGFYMRDAMLKDSEVSPDMMSTIMNNRCFVREDAVQYLDPDKYVYRVEKDNIIVDSHKKICAELEKAVIAGVPGKQNIEAFLALDE